MQLAARPMAGLVFYNYIRQSFPLNIICHYYYNFNIIYSGGDLLAKTIKDGASFNQRDVIDFLAEFSSFKDRVEKKFKEVSKELEGKVNEHDLWVELYLIATDYAEELVNKKGKHDSVVQKVS
jgi:hypothetical protein